jgi:alpha-ketoglutaric semialdehyde dehydrogenase
LQWSRTNPHRRAEILSIAAAELKSRATELGVVLAREEGKTIAEGVGEVTRSAEIMSYFAGQCLLSHASAPPSARPNVTIEVTREALGVIAIISPWNFPMAIPTWKIAPALAFGNTVVFKPAEIVPASAWALVDVLHRAGLPKGVLNLVMGRGSEIGPILAAHEGINGISFTGSVQTGHDLASEASKSKSLKRLQLEMGGKNPLVVLADADLDTAVECAVNSAYFATGQRCTAASRFIVVKAIHDEFVGRLTKRMSNLVVGHALETTTHIGPVAHQKQLEQNLRYVEHGVKEGATLEAGGRELYRATKGYFFEPALFTDVTNSMTIAREEIFGPVAAVIKVADYEEAIHVANDTQFGLSAGICTSSLKYSHAFKRDSQAGMVMVNLPTAGVDFTAPFGGRKASSLGSREQGAYAVEFFTTVKTAYTSV